MKKLFNLLRGRIELPATIKTHVLVTSSAQGEPLFFGRIQYVNFPRREVVVVQLKDKTLQEIKLHFFKFDNIVSIVRMVDGRIRIWIRDTQNYKTKRL